MLLWPNMNWGEWSLLACLNLKIIVLQLLLNYFGGFEFCLILISRLFFFYFQVSAIQEEANRLQGSYAGDKAKEIQAKEDEVVDAWKRLNWRVKQRTERLHDADDLYRFLLAVQDQMLWMNDMLKQILTYEKAK